jgi:hypothetical protein
MSKRATLQARSLVILLAIALFLGAAVSLFLNLRKLDSQYLELARIVGRTTSETLLAMRNWNTQHQGVYVPLSPDVHPNEYLVDPLRDLISTQGIQLTKINHAQMTRMIADLLDQERGLHVHLTSLTPIRPMNAADLWERGALAGFAKGEREAYELQSDAKGEGWFRYMAPLKAESSCMACHHEHKSVDEIRGGVSVSFSYTPFQALMDQSKRQIWLLHIFGLCASLVPIFFLGRKLTQNVSELQATLLRVRQLEGLVPICASCKKIRIKGAEADIQMSWVPVEKYISERTDAEFSHGICPDCRQRLYPELSSPRKI